MTNIAMERSTMLLIGKPSISMGHLYHGELLVITSLGKLGNGGSYGFTNIRGDPF